MSSSEQSTQTSGGGNFDRSSTITIINQLPSASLERTYYDDIHGGWDKTPAPFIPPSKSDMFKLADHIGPAGSEGIVKYAGGGSERTISFACPTTADSWVNLDPPGSGSVGPFDKNGPLIATVYISK
ncbi:hypothetical protein BOTBODRAFT_173200 [Botryobasidium botryosum FD-172 SS1]|uniref:Uncharacterized protein n=1 Tax=Botryobasidium botryosum (strain FD-172 SS1) TaxID=930990 RepID=A0A067ML79_BOTB1|nr:hypothetical protein BOTBODRAFT_173200 [Botryobasidium botryosum FD-172 SS1]